MIHPDPKFQKKQTDFLNQCPLSDREFHATLFRIGNAAYIYHQLAYDINDETQKIYYDEWLEGLPENIKKSMKKLGFEGCKNSFPFTRYVNERNDVGMDEWMRQHLSPEDYLWYKKEPETQNEDSNTLKEV